MLILAKLDYIKKNSLCASQRGESLQQNVTGLNVLQTLLMSNQFMEDMKLLYHVNILLNTKNTTPVAAY
jgi:hypothetical protein